MIDSQIAYENVIASMLVIHEQDPVWSVAVSTDGRWIASTSWGLQSSEQQRPVIRIWEAKSGKLARTSLAAMVSFAGLVAFESIRKGDSTIPASVLLNRTAGLCLVYSFCASAAFSVIDYYVRLDHSTVGMTHPG